MINTKSVKLFKYTDMDNEQYHGDKTTISRSAIMDFKKSPRKYWANYLNHDKPAKEQTTAMRIGNAFHMFILEPHIFQTTYLIEPSRVLLKDAGREAYELYKLQMNEIENSGRPVLSQSEWGTIHSMAISLQNHSKAMKLIGDAEYEASYFWIDEDSGLKVKARPDIYHADAGIYVDIKTIDDASPENFSRSMAAYGNHIQGAMVQDAIAVSGQGKPVETVINICVEKTYPYSIGIYIIDEAALDYGRMQYKDILLQMKKCQEENNWPDYQIQTIGLPKWAMY